MDVKMLKFPKEVPLSNLEAGDFFISNGRLCLYISTYDEGTCRVYDFFEETFDTYSSDTRVVHVTTDKIKITVEE